MNPRRLHGPVLTRLRLARGGEEGFALPTVLGLLLVATVLLTAVTAVTMNAVGSATSSRAAVQAQSSAEAGLARAQAAIASNQLACTYAPTNAAVVSYVVQVQYGAGVTGAPSCPTPAGASGTPADGTVRIVSTGDATAKGSQGNQTGDRRRLQGIMTAATVPAPAASAPTTPTTTTGFDRAVFVGSGNPQSSGNWTLQNGSSTTGGLYVNGKLTCGGTIDVNGPAVVWGDAALNGGSGGCQFKQGLVVTGDLNCTNTSITGVLSVKGSTTTSSCNTTGDFVSNGPVTCNGSTIGGRLISTTGSLRLESGCKVTGAVYAATTGYCNGATLSSTYSAQGTANFDSGCSVSGDAFVGGDMPCAGTFDGNLSVQGAVSANSTCQVGKDLRALGDFKNNRYAVAGAMISTNGTLSAAQGSAKSLTLRNDPASTNDYQGMSVNGTSCSPSSWWPKVTPGCTWKTASNTSVPPAPPKSPVTTAPDQPDAAQTMPVVTASSLGSPSTTWGQLVRERYLAHGVTQWAESRFSNPADTCGLTAPSTVRQDTSGDSLNGPVDAPASVSVVDARACSTLQLRDSSIVLSGDLTLLVSSFTTTNGLRVTKSSSLPAGTTPTLRIVVPMAEGTTTCAANGSAGTITANSGGTVLGSDVSVLLYSAGKVDMSNSFSFYGQMYACQIPNLQNDVTVNYRSVAPTTTTTTTTTTTGGGAGTGSTAGGWTLTDVRDLPRS